MPFISIEGIDGSGKSTQIDLLVDALCKINLDVVKTKEPDGGLIGSGVRAILVAEREVKLSPVEEMLLISAARASHVNSVIRPALVARKWVVSDRFLDSTYAFQVHGTDVSDQLYFEICSTVVGDTMPDLTFILDIDPAKALARRSSRNDISNPDPSEATRDFSRIREGLLLVAQRDPKRCRVIDADLAVGEVAELILSEVKNSALLN